MDKPAKRVPTKRRKKGSEGNNTVPEKPNETDSSAPRQSGDVDSESASTRKILEKNNAAPRKSKKNAENPKQGWPVPAESRWNDSGERAVGSQEFERDSSIPEERSNEKDSRPDVAKEKDTAALVESIEETAACQEESFKLKDDKSIDLNELKERAVVSEEQPKVGGDAGPSNNNESSSVGFHAKEPKDKGVMISEEPKEKEGCSSTTSMELEDDVDGDCTLALFLDRLKKRRLLLHKCKKRQLHGGRGVR